VHLAGIGNFTGVNLKSMDDEYITELVPYTHLHGLQVAGIFNLVRGDIAGGQVSGLFNVAHRELVGAQIGGFFNYTGRYASGVQIAGIGNFVSNATFGSQFSLLYNRTGEELYGTQLALINSVKKIEGKNSLLENNRTGLQIGLVNLANKMNGFQVGLINYSRKMQGTQLGLINIGGPVYKSGAKQGTFIGLLNVGNVVNLSVYSSELFLLNTMLYTGIIKNGQIRAVSTNKYLLNGVSWSTYSSDPSLDEMWALGYQIARLVFNRSSVPELNEKRFFGYHFHYYHINKTRKFEWNLNEIFQFGLKSGIRFHPKIGIYGFAALNMNMHVSGKGLYEQPQKIIPFGIEVEGQTNNYTIGPGVNFGLLFH
jgi:hypothetical protein